MVPVIARYLASLVNTRGASFNSPPSWRTSTQGCTASWAEPFLPLIETCWPSTVTVTPADTGIGFLPTREVRILVSFSTVAMTPLP